jgi:cytochrome bd-type quinol oxidase subunit 2
MQRIRNGFPIAALCLLGSVLAFVFMAQGGLQNASDSAQHLASWITAGLMFLLAGAAVMAARSSSDPRTRTATFLAAALSVLLFFRIFISVLAVTVLKG